MSTVSSTSQTTLSGSFTAFSLGESMVEARLFDPVTQAIEHSAVKSLAGRAPCEGYLLGQRLPGPEPVIEIHDVVAGRLRGIGLPFVVGCYRSRPHVGTELTPADTDVAVEHLGNDGYHVILVVDPSAGPVPQARFHLLENGRLLPGSSSVAFPLNVTDLGGTPSTSPLPPVALMPSPIQVHRPRRRLAWIGSFAAAIAVGVLTGAARTETPSIVPLAQTAAVPPIAYTAPPENSPVNAAKRHGTAPANFIPTPGAVVPEPRRFSPPTTLQASTAPPATLDNAPLLASAALPAGGLTLPLTTTPIAPPKPASRPSGPATLPALVRQLQPILNEKARRLVRGDMTVKVNVEVDEKGMVRRASAEGGPDLLAAASAAAALQAHFAPATQDGRPVAGFATLQFHFTEQQYRLPIQSAIR